VIAEANGVLYLDYGSVLNTATGKRITIQPFHRAGRP
jgi:hypothetical protein